MWLPRPQVPLTQRHPGVSFPPPSWEVGPGPQILDGLMLRGTSPQRACFSKACVHFWSYGDIFFFNRLANPLTSLHTNVAKCSYLRNLDERCSGILCTILPLWVFSEVWSCTQIKNYKEKTKISSWKRFIKTNSIIGWYLKLIKHTKFRYDWWRK